MFRYFCILFCVLLCVSCGGPLAPGDCLKGRGREDSVERQVEDFRKIYVTDKIDLYLHQDVTRKNQVRISGGENLIGKIRTEIREGVLHISDENSCNFVRDLQARSRVDVWIDTLTMLEMHGMSSIYTPEKIKFQDFQIDFLSSRNSDIQLDVNVLILNHSGVGELGLSGNAAVYTVTLYNVAGADARNLVTDWAFVYSYSTADVWLKPMKGFGCYLYEAGNAYYTQEPWYLLTYVREGKGERLYQPAS